MVTFVTLDLMYKMKSEVKKTITRYAPSPTGSLHLGGARTAIFCYLYAKHNKGEFLFRLEDTDIDRNLVGGEENQLDGLKWLGINPDFYPGKEGEFGPLRQSERLEIYDKYAKELVEKGHAYYCNCSKERLEKLREEQQKEGMFSFRYDGKCFKEKVKNTKGASIRLHVPKGKIFKWDDGVRGEISVPSESIGDWVIVKSNGIPTYNFANVVDDNLMKVTDVMRGEEHISNTPKQLHLYEIFNWETPRFHHLTIIINDNGKKLSKRDESVMQFIHLYKETGYLPEAVLNFLSLLGWSPKNEEEIFDKNKLIELFDISGLSKSPSKFDIEKLKWINNTYIKKLNDVELKEFLIPFSNNIFNFSEEIQDKIRKLFQPQLREGREFEELTKLFTNNYEDVEKDFIEEHSLILKNLKEKLPKIINWNLETIKEMIKTISDETNLKGKNLLLPIRIFISREKSGPELAQVINILGKEETIKRVMEL